MLISALLEVGVKAEEIVEMAQANPRRLLNAR
jgi:predicted metal-dependent phosphotriesterase family hydrolase